jgi:hypothetical protein
MLQFKLMVPKDGCIEDLCKALSAINKVASDRVGISLDAGMLTVNE